MRHFLIFLVFYLSFSCTRHDCKCPLDTLSTKRLSEKSTYSEKNPVKITPAIEAKIKKIANLSVEAEAELGIRRTTLDKELREFSVNIDSSLAIKFQIKRIFFCARYELMCKKGKYSDEYIIENTSKYLEKLETEIFDLKENINDETEIKKTTEPKKNKFKENHKIVCLEPNVPVLEEYLMKKHNLSTASSSENTCNIDIKITESGEIIKLSKSLYKYHGGNLLVVINGKVFELDNINTASNSLYGNPLTLVKKEIDAEVIQLIFQNKEKILKIINNEIQGI